MLVVRINGSILAWSEASPPMQDAYFPSSFCDVPDGNAGTRATERRTESARTFVDAFLQFVGQSLL